MGGKFMIENRILNRWKVEIPCSFDWEGTPFSAKIVDISFIGARIQECAAAPDRKELVFLRLRVGNEAVTCPGEVIHHCGGKFSEESKCFGVEFRGAAADLTSILVPVVREYVRNRAD